MRSDIFKSYADLPEEFDRDLETLWRLDDDQRRKLIPALLELLQADTNLDHEAVIEQTVADIDGNDAELLRSLKVLQFISREWNPVEDTPEGFIADLKSLSLLPEDKEGEASVFLLEFFSRLQEDNLRRLKKMYANSLLPSYLGVTTLVDFRPVFDPPFGSRSQRKVEEYRPNCVAWVPVILVRLRRNSGQARTFEFQCEENDVRWIIERLEAALRDLETARSHLPVEWEEE